MPNIFITCSCRFSNPKYLFQLAFYICFNVLYLVWISSENFLTDWISFWKQNTIFFDPSEMQVNRHSQASLVHTLNQYDFKNTNSKSLCILNWHCLSLSLNADLCIHFYWLSRLRQASHIKMIQSSALSLRLWLCHFKISSDTSALRLIILCTKVILVKNKLCCRILENRELLSCSQLALY